MLTVRKENNHGISRGVEISWPNSVIILQGWGLETIGTDELPHFLKRVVFHHFIKNVVKGPALSWGASSTTLLAALRSAHF